MSHTYYYRTSKRPSSKVLDVGLLAGDTDLADRCNVTVENSFHALCSRPDDIEDSWSAIRDTILQSARDTLVTLPVTIRAKRRWLTSETLYSEKKCDTRLRGSVDECLKQKSVFKARSSKVIWNSIIIIILQMNLMKD